MFTTCNKATGLFLVSFGLMITLSCALYGGPADPSHQLAAWGYPFEQHWVPTGDGWILNVIRIPYGRNQSYEADRPVVFIQHGFIDSAAGWLLNTPNENLPTILADAGYDVWLGNNRGNSYSFNNILYFPNESRYWDFSFDDMASRDLTAMIPFVANYYHPQANISYIGLSQGTAQAFAAFSEQPNFFEKYIKLFVALAPIAFMSHVQSPFLQFLSKTNSANLLGMRKFTTDPDLLRVEIPVICNNSALAFLCDDILKFLYGGDAQTNHSRDAEMSFSENEPDWTSTKVVIHFTQMINSGKFCKFDYGTEGNLLFYNQTTPPEYPLSALAIPTAIFSGGLDQLADASDVDLLIAALPSATLIGHTVIQNFTHADWNWSDTAAQLAYPQLLTLLRNYN